MKLIMVGGNKRTVIFILLFVCLYKPSYDFKNMEITDFLNKSADAKYFINKHFVSVNDIPPGPFFPKRVDRINKPDINFLGIKTVQCWAVEADDSFAFFLLIDKHTPLIEMIINHFGEPNIRINVSTDLQPQGEDLFQWHQSNFNLYPESYLNTLKNAKYDNCNLLIITNLNLKQLPLQQIKIER